LCDYYLIIPPTASFYPEILDMWGLSISIVNAALRSEPQYRSHIATRLRAGRPGNLGSIPGRGKRFSLLHKVQTVSGTHAASYPVGTGEFFSGGKAVGA
jgi:hypothetical protein